MKLYRDRLVDEKNKFVIVFDEGEDWSDYVVISIYDNKNINITEQDLTDWEFAEFPNLYVFRTQKNDEIKIANKKLGIVGKVVIECNSVLNASYWSEKLEEL